MHYALPPRKSARPPAYMIRPNRSQLARLRPSFILIVAIGALTSIYLLLKLFSFGGSSSPAGTFSAKSSPLGTSSVVVVTVFDDKQDAAIWEMVRRNREAYAEVHGYDTFFPSTQNYTIKNTPHSWAKVPALRQAMTLFPQATFYFYLDPHTLIMNPTISLESHITQKEKLESLMITDVPIVPPDSVIKTFSGLKGDRVDLILTQDKDGLSEKSFILRRGEWAKYLLDAWFDPLYRSYNFQKAERHALEHIVQWHGTILAKIALVPQNIMNSYHEKESAMATDNGLYKEGDFILNFGDCSNEKRNCETEMTPYASRSKQTQAHDIK